MSTRVVYDDTELHHLPAGVHIREIGALGRSFVTDRIPGRLWLGATVCTVGVLDMPVEVTA